jgi:integrase
VGTVFKKTFTKPLRAGAELFTREGQQFARWKDAKGKTRKALVTASKDGQARILIEARTYFAKYRDGAGVVQIVATGCRDETAARQMLADLERQAERVRRGVITATEAAIGDHLSTPIAEHFAAYVASLEAAGTCDVYRANARRQLDRLADDCSFRRLADLSREAMERWLSVRAREGMGARTRNTYLVTAICFANWCADPNVRRLAGNPFDGIIKANEKIDPRRQRRAMTEAELVTLLAAAGERPLLDALTVRRGKRKGERCANVRPEVRARLDWIGRERRLTYKTLVLTGLRKGELASLTVGQLHLDGAVPFASLDAADEKNRQGSEIILRDDLADDLRQWLADKLAKMQAEARDKGEPIPARLPADTPVFNVPSQLCKILDRDLRLAGIAKRDDRGRTLDVHALRHTFGTLMSKGGVAPRTAQAAMRHSKIDLTMNVYTDPALLDVRGALEMLPALPLGVGSNQTEAVMTGTDGSPLAPPLAPTWCKRATPLSKADKMTTDGQADKARMAIAVNLDGDNAKQPLTIIVKGCQEVERKGIEPSTSRMPF